MVTESPSETVRVWLVERTYSDDVSMSTASRGS
jgi:hypothetical protein